MTTGVLAELEAEMVSVDLSVSADAALASLLQRALHGRQVVNGYINQLTGEIRRREAAGSGAPARDVLREKGTVSSREAKNLEERAAMGELLPATGDKVDRGEARSENADTLTRQLAGLTDTQRTAVAVHDREIARQAATAAPEAFTRWLRRLIRRVTEADPEPGQSREERQRAASRFGMKRRPDGMWELFGRIDDARGAALNDVLTRTARHLNNGEANPNAKADALHRLVTRRTDPSGESGDGLEPTARMGVGYIVDLATLLNGPHDRSVAQTWAGDDLEPEDIGPLSCDADLYAMLYDQLGEPVRVGRTRRAATREQRLQLRGLYDRCPIDGSPFGDCHIHHVNVFWEDAGETDVENLLPISRDWHHRIHQRGWRLKMYPDRSLKLWRPDGKLHRAIPPPAPITRQHE